MYSIANQANRFDHARTTCDARYLSIKLFYDGIYMKDKRVLVTGGNRGLGLAIVKELVTQGADVVVVGRRSSEALEALKVHVITGVDVCDEATITNQLSELEVPFDHVINNAGYFWDGEETMENIVLLLQNESIIKKVLACIQH